MEYCKNDAFVLGGHTFESRFILGSGKYSLDLIKAAVEKAGAQIITLALRRANEGGMANILDYIPENVTLLPNTSRCQKCGGSCSYSASVQRTWVRRFREDRGHPRLKISAA